MNLTREILPDLETQEDDTMFQGQQRIIQEGEAGQSSVLSRVVKRCGVPVASNDLSAVTLSEPPPSLWAPHQGHAGAPRRVSLPLARPGSHHL